MNLLISGDCHGDLNYLEYICYRATKCEAKTVVLLGDVGMYWPGNKKDFQQQVSHYAKQYDVDIYALDGNHDGHHMLQHDAEDFVQLAERFFYIPRGFSWVWGSKKFLGIGGAWSIDKAQRIPHVSWWPNEEPSEDQIERACSVGKVNYVLAHDAPQWAIVPGYTHIGEAASRTRRLLQKVWDSSQCEVWYHGHHHVRYADFVQGRKCMGLAHNFSPSKAWTLLEV